MTTPDPGLPNLPEDATYGSVIGPAEWNAHAERINDVEDANADDTAILRGATATAASTAAKVVTLADPDRVPVAGDLLLIEFTAGNTASTPTLNVNGSGALGLTGASGSTTSTANAIAAGVEVLVLHDADRYRALTGNQTYSPVASTQYWPARPGAGALAGFVAARLSCIATNTWRLIAGATF